jgi:thermitase
LAALGSSLALATRAPDVGRAAPQGSRDPRAARVNQSTTLSWVSGRQGASAALDALSKRSDVAWVAPVFRATGGEKTEASYFAFDPTVIFLSPQAIAAIGDVSAIDPTAVFDQARTQLLKGLVVVNLPGKNALDLVTTLKAKLGATAPGGIKLENLPYLSPTTSCGCHEGRPGPSDGRPRCAPATRDLVPDDPFFSQQWGLQRINAPRAWPITEGDPTVVVAVLDQGVELAHPDLDLDPVSYSTITHTNDGGPVGNHGTACAGIVSARIANGTGVAGLAGKCRVMAIATDFADTQVAEGLYYAADHGARVVSMSFGVYPSWMIWDLSVVTSALQYCQAHGVVLVAATGNENQAVSRFPATDPTTIGVGGSNRDDLRKSIGDTSIENWWGACYGPDVDVVAPCLEIPTTDRLGAAGYDPGDYYMRFNGTSSATPHVAALAGLILSVDPALSNLEVRRILSETTDKIGTPAYVYANTAGKPYGTWNAQVGYGRINAERALLVACAMRESCASGPCGVELPEPDRCCVSPCDPPWRPGEQCMVWYEDRYWRIPIPRRDPPVDAVLGTTNLIEFRVTYEHTFCLLGKQHGPLLFTQTLLPGEKVTLYHSERYRRVSTESSRFSVQTTFMQFLSAVHQARVTSTVSALSDKLINVESNASVSVGGGLAGFLGAPGGSTTTQGTVSSQSMLAVGVVADTFNQSATQSSQMTQAERSVTVSTYEEKDVADVTRRTIQNDNECRAVTYFIRKVVELYSSSTRVSAVLYRVVAPNFPADWHAIGDVAWLPVDIRNEIKAPAEALPRFGTVVEQPRPISLPTDGTVYDPELAHCCSCEPERAAAIDIRLRKENAEALRACLEAKLLEMELERRRLLLQSGNLAVFAPPAAPTTTGP